LRADVCATGLSYSHCPASWNPKPARVAAMARLGTGLALRRQAPGHQPAPLARELLAMEERLRDSSQCERVTARPHRGNPVCRGLAA